MALAKRDVLEFLQRQGRPVPAKALAIDFDSRASAASEILERAASQGLVFRNPAERPRLYRLTPSGLRRLEFFRSRDGNRSAPAEADPEAVPGRTPNQNAGVSASGVAPLPPGVDGSALSQKLDTMRHEVCSRLDALREDFRDLLDILPANPSSEASASPADAAVQKGNVTSRVQALLERAERLAHRAASDQSNKPSNAQKLYEMLLRLDAGDLSRSERRALRDDITRLESEIAPEMVGRIRALREVEERRVWRWKLDEKKKQVAALRQELGLSPFKAEPDVIEKVGAAT